MKNIVQTNKKVLILSLLSILICSTQVSVAQEDSKKSNNFQIELRTNYGFFIHHHLEMTRFPARFPSFELSFQQATYGKKDWQAYFNYPIIGITAYYSSLGNTDVIGQAVALYPFINFPFNKSKINTVSFRFGVGLGYLTKKYDRHENFQNTSIGSHFNAAISLSLEYRRRIAKRYDIAAFIGLTHFSNGSSRCPNNGINMAQCGLSAACLINEPQEYIPKRLSDNKQYKKWNLKTMSYYFGFSYSFKDIDECIGYNKTFSVYNLYVNIFKQISRLNKIGVGLDLAYDTSDKTALLYDGISYSNDFQLIKTGINIAYELMMDNTSFIINMGYHITGKEMDGGKIYQKLSLKQNISKHLFACIGLTTHFARADYIGFGLGFKIN